MSNLRLLITQKTNFMNFNGISRHYSVFAPKFVEPIFRKEEQQKLYDSNEVQNLIHKCYKPAMSDATSSEFYDAAIKKLTNYVMRKGNKQLARALVAETFENIKRAQVTRYHKADLNKKEQIELDPKVIFHKAVENCKPVLQLTTIRKGGISYQVPIPVTEGRAIFLSMNWLIEAAKDKERSVHFPETLAKEIINAYYNQGRVIKRKQDLHKQCDANRAYAHFRWIKT